MYRQNYSVALVLEDDALLRVGFVRRLAEVMSDVPRPFDIVMVGGCMNMHAWRRKFNATMITKHVYRKQEARCAHAFVVSQRGARRLLSSLPLSQAIDFQMTSAMHETNMDVYWVEPFLSVQGKTGECVTNLDLGARCVSTEKYSKEFDGRFVNDTTVYESWESVPAFHSRR
jgi:GR25 family glycosyltransferase involved in LPS biosynthesis